MNEPHSRRSMFRIILLTGAIIIACCISACQVVYYYARNLPAIQGEVLDMRTGQAIANADVGACYLGRTESLAAPARPIRIGGGGTCKTDSHGRFRFPAMRLPISSPISLLVGPPKKTGIWLFVYSKDYVPCLSEAEGFDWRLDRLISAWGWTCVHLERFGSLRGGFTYSVRMSNPKTEVEWQQKIQITGRASGSLPEELAQEWLYSDLTGYLARWPKGEKAAEYLGTAMFSALVRHERAKTLGRADERRFLEEDLNLLTLAQTVPKSAGHPGYSMYGWEENLPQINEEYERLSKALGQEQER